MATRRSLNKLEFKAHMSIHNTKDVEEADSHESNATRDRFGKKHRLSEQDGIPRIRRRRSVPPAAIALLASLVCFSAQAASESTIPSTTRNTDIRIETEGLDENSWLNRKLTPEEKFGIPVDESTTIGFNEDGDPNMSTRF